MRFILLLSLGALLSSAELCTGRASEPATKSEDPDLLFLRDAKLPTDGPGLLESLKNMCGDDHRRLVLIPQDTITTSTSRSFASIWSA